MDVDQVEDTSCLEFPTAPVRDHDAGCEPESNPSGYSRLGAFECVFRATTRMHHDTVALQVRSGVERGELAVGFISRLFDRSQAAPRSRPRTADALGPMPRQATPTMVPDTVTRRPTAAMSEVVVTGPYKAFHLVADSRIAVVGESHYQPALRWAVDSNHSDGGLPVAACLVREPENKYDRNAVRIDVQGKTVGYIARVEAPWMQEKLKWLEHQGLRPVCQARVFGGGPGKPNYGIVLHAGHALNGFSNEIPAGSLAMLDGSSMTTVTGEEHHQETLDPYAPRDQDSVSYVFATLGLCEITNGKYKGQQALEVRVNGQRVGQLTYAMTQRYRPEVEAGLSADHVVVVSAMLRREEKVEVYLLMPEPR